MNTPSIVVAGSAPAPAATEFRWEGQLCNGLGATYGLPPMAWLGASSTHLILSGPLGTFNLPLTSVIRISRGRMYPWFFAGIRVHHHDPKCPVELQFKPLGVPTREVVARLRALGYPAG